MCVVKEEWGRSTYVFSEDILAYHAELEDLSSECQTGALFLVKRDELDDEMIESTQLVLEVGVLYLTASSALMLVLLRSTLKNVKKEQRGTRNGRPKIERSKRISVSRSMCKPVLRLCIL